MMGLGLDTESLAEIMKNCNERLNQIRFEAMEKLKRSAFFIDFSSSLKVHVTEINVDQTVSKEIEKSKEETIQRQKKKKSRKKGLNYFLDDEKEPVQKKKKGVVFDLDANQVKEFDKTEAISEEVRPLTKKDKSMAQ